MASYSDGEHRRACTYVCSSKSPDFAQGRGCVNGSHGGNREYEEDPI